MLMSVEGFGMSHGTLVQLQSASVPSMGYMGPPYFLR